MPPTYQWRREDYNRTAKLEEFLPWFKDWKFDWLDVPGLIRELPARLRISAGRPRSDPAMDLRPRHADGRRRASDVPDRLQRRLAGDPGCPRLTREILAHGPTNAALVAYEAERRPATTDLVMLNRRNGPEQVMQLVEERAPDGFNVVTDVLSHRSWKTSPPTTSASPASRSKG